MNTENTQPDDQGQNDTLEDQDQVDESSSGDTDVATDEDAQQQGEDKFVSVKFSRGNTSRSYSDTLFGGTKHVYSFGVAQDQTISVRLASSDDGAYLKIFDPSGEPIRMSGDSTRFTESVPESGKYRIEVWTSSNRSDYTVRFSASALPPKDDGGDVVQSGGLMKTVRFAKGRSSASYSGAVIRGESDTYVLGASGGQMMSVSISSVENNAVFQVEGPGGYLRGAEPGSDRTSWSGQLPANGKYRVIVGPTRGNATYTVSIAIR